MKKLVFIALLTSASIKAFCQDSLSYLTKPPLNIFEKKGEILLDGKIEEDAWTEASSFKFIEFRPDWGNESPHTKLFITYDQKYLYVGAQIFAFEKDKVIGRNLVRDGWLGDDWFAFHIDSKADKQNAMVFSIYPLGSRYDLAVSNDAVRLGNSTFNAAYDMLWEGKTFISDHGWSLEMKIPLSNLRFQIKNGKVFSSISAATTANYKNELFVFPAIPRGINSEIMKPSIKQPVVFENLIPRKQVLVSPFVLAGQNKEYMKNNDETAYLKEQDFTRDVGLDVRFSLSSKLTLDATINPDFAQAEADNQQVNLSRYSLFFPERRRFFQEQAGLYEFNLGSQSQLFYSRRIGIVDSELVPIVGGGRLTGRVGDWDLGFLNMQTAETQLSEEVQPTENFSVLRLRHNVFNQRSFAGIMATSRLRNGYENINIGGDALINLKREVYLMTSLAYSYNPSERESEILNDDIRFYFELKNRVNAGWNYSLTYNYSGKDFNPGVGFLDRENFHNPYFELGHGKFKNKGEGRFQYRRWTFLGSDQFWDAETGKLQSWFGYHSWTGRNFKGDSFEFTWINQYEHLNETLEFTDKININSGAYHFSRFFVSFNPAEQKKFRTPISIGYGSFYNGKRLRISFSPSINVNKYLSLTANWQANKLDFDNENISEWIHVGRIRAQWAINLHLSGSFMVQYNSVSKSYFNVARLRYNFRDGHNLYVVYNEQFNRDKMRETPILPTSQSQTLLLKYVYTFFK